MTLGSSSECSKHFEGLRRSARERDGQNTDVPDRRIARLPAAGGRDRVVSCDAPAIRLFLFPDTRRHAYGVLLSGIVGTFGSLRRRDRCRRRHPLGLERTSPSPNHPEGRTCFGRFDGVRAARFADESPTTPRTPAARALLSPQWPPCLSTTVGHSAIAVCRSGTSTLSVPPHKSDRVGEQ